MHDTNKDLESASEPQEFGEDVLDASELREQNRKMRKALRRAVVELFRSNQPHMTRDILATLKEMNEALR